MGSTISLAARLPRVQAEIRLYARIPVVVAERAPIGPLFVGHSVSPLEERVRIGPDGVAYCQSLPVATSKSRLPQANARRGPRIVPRLN